MLWKKIENNIQFCIDHGQKIKFWWRDDDAVYYTKALQKLYDIASEYDVPLHVAVIPQDCKEAFLVPQNVTIWQHGLSHYNFALPLHKKSEFPEERCPEDFSDALVMSKIQLQELFGDSFVPVFVPPWNRIASCHLDTLSSLGFFALSRYGKKGQTKICELNTHLDVVNSKTMPKSFQGETVILSKLDAEIQMRINANDFSEPIGLLTHHLDHDSFCWSFVDSLIAFLVRQNVIFIDSYKWIKNANLSI